MAGFGLESLIPKKVGSREPAEPPQAAGAGPSLPREEFQWPTAEEGGHGTLGEPSGLRRERSSPPHSESIFHIEVHLIRPNPYQPRREFPEADIEELARSIREFGVLQPLVVSKAVRETATGTEVAYELIAGERRLLAARRAGLERVPAVVRRVDGVRAKLELALIENLQRSDLTPLETARAYARLQDEFGLSQREVAERVGRSREAVANTLRLLNLPEEVRRALGAGKINESQARALLAVEDASARERSFRELLARGGTVRGPREKRVPAPPADPEGAYWERRLEEKFGAPVRVTKRGNRGKVEIRFHSEEEWHGLVEKLAGGEGAE